MDCVRPCTKKPVQLIAEIGINHNGDINIAKKLIRMAADAGFNYAKIQKRNPDVCVPEAQKSKPKSTPWGEMTYLEYKHSIEFSEEQVVELIAYARDFGIVLFASVWDLDSVDVMARHSTISKIPSALITNLELCRYARSKFDTLIISTGMSTEEEIEACVAACSPDVIMHTNSTYPCPYEDLNLNYIKHLKEKYPEAESGYSGHEFGLTTTYATVALGVQWIERHVTLCRKMWGSDQLSSVEPSGMIKMVKGIRDLEKAFAYPPGDRILFEKEKSKRLSLRGN